MEVSRWVERFRCSSVVDPLLLFAVLKIDQAIKILFGEISR